MVIPSTRKGNPNNNHLHGNSHGPHGDEVGLHLYRTNYLQHHPRHGNDARIENPEPNKDWVSGTGDEVLLLNVGGMSFRIRIVSIFSRSENEKIVQFAQFDQERRIATCDAYLAQTQEYFFERSPILFDAIYKYYATGQLHRPLDICPQEFQNELDFWRVSHQMMSMCCWRSYAQMLTAPKLRSESMEELAHKKSQQMDMKDRSMRARIHAFCEGDGSLPSTLFTFGSISFVLISVIGLVLGSIHELQVPIVKKGNKAVRVMNVTAVLDEEVIWEPHPVFGIIETICIIWFTLEFALRLSVTPNRIQFLVGIMNVVDMIAIVPFYLEMGLAMFGVDVASLSDIKGALLVVRVLRVLRVVRILKLGRYSSGMRTFALTLKSSARQLGMMGMVLTTGVVFFSTLLYFVEKDEKDTPFTSIPAAFWWAIVTMTTVGYGDYVPVTIPGKLIASGAIISGVLVLALPITIIVDNFMKVSGNNRNPFSSQPPAPDTTVTPGLHH